MDPIWPLPGNSPSARHRHRPTEGTGRGGTDGRTGREDGHRPPRSRSPPSLGGGGPAPPWKGNGGRGRGGRGGPRTPPSVCGGVSGREQGVRGSWGGGRFGDEPTGLRGQERAARRPRSISLGTGKLRVCVGPVEAAGVLCGIRRGRAATGRPVSPSVAFPVSGRSADTAGQRCLCHPRELQRGRSRRGGLSRGCRELAAVTLPAFTES